MRIEAIWNHWIRMTFLILCLILCFSLGCSKGKKKAEHRPGEEWIADMRERVEASIADPDKKSQILNLVAQMETALMNLDQLMQKHYSDLFIIDRNYEAVPEDFRKEFADFNTARYEIRDQILEARFAIRELATPEEWQKLTDISKKKGLFKMVIQYPSL